MAIELQHLKLAQESLQRGMRSCHNRETFLKLCANAYQPILTCTYLPAFAASLTEGRPIQSDITPLTVSLDQTLAGLVLDNALTNAMKHGDPEVSPPSLYLAVLIWFSP